MSVYEQALALCRAARMCDVLDAAERKAYEGNQLDAKVAMFLARLTIAKAR